MSTQVRVVSVEAVPIQEAVSTTDASGAYANIYLVSQNDDVAVKLAVRELTAAGWNIVSAPEIRTVDAESFTGADDGLKHYQQCLVDGAVIVLHTWRDEH